MLAPIVIFAYNRPDALTRLVESLQKSELFAKSHKIVYVDGPKSDNEVALTKQVAEFAKTFANEVYISRSNKGLGASIINGVTEVINKYGKAIVLEDDLYAAPSFLDFINKALDFYEDDKRICSICGYSLKIKVPKGTDVYLSNRASSWGWATWQDRWNQVDWQVSDYVDFICDSKKRKSFNRGGSDMTSMLKGYMTGRNKSWAIRFCYWQWKNELWSIHPAKSLVENYGFGENASNCKQKYSRFKTDLNLDYEADWSLIEDITPNKSIIKKLQRYHSIPIRIYSRIRKFLDI